MHTCTKEGKNKLNDSRLKCVGQLYTRGTTNPPYSSHTNAPVPGATLDHGHFVGVWKG